MSKKFKLRKVYVSDKSVEDALKSKKERWLLGKGANGPFICVSAYYNEEYGETGEIKGTKCWLYIAEIPEPKTRPMTQLEIVKFL